MFGFVLWFKMINYHTYFFSPFWRKWPCLAFSCNSEKSTVWSIENWWERTCWLAAFHIQLYVLGLISLVSHSSQFLAGDLINAIQKSQDCIKMLLLMGMADIFQVVQLFQTVYYCLLFTVNYKYYSKLFLTMVGGLKDFIEKAKYHSTHDQRQLLFKCIMFIEFIQFSAQTQASPLTASQVCCSCSAIVKVKHNFTIMKSIHI